MANSHIEFLNKLEQQESPIREYHLINCRRRDEDVEELVDEMIRRPDIVTHLWWSENYFTDRIGVKLAQLIAVSTKLEWVSLTLNNFTHTTFFAVAAALRVNRSLRVLRLNGNQLGCFAPAVKAAFIEALRVNPTRPPCSDWSLVYRNDDYESLKAAADELRARAFE